MQPDFTMTPHSSAPRTYFAHPHALVETDFIGAGTRIWAFAHVQPDVQIGAGCNICDHTFIETGAVLGNNVTVKNGVAIWSGVTVEDNVFLGPNCVLTNDPNPRAYIKKSVAALRSTLIHANATIGANATILCGITIGRFAFVGAGAVVLKSVPDFALMVGNPARHVGWMCQCATRLTIPPSVSLNSSIICRHCRTEFRVNSGRLSLSSNGR